MVLGERVAPDDIVGKPGLEDGPSPSSAAAAPTPTVRSRAPKDSASLGGLQRCLVHHLRITLEVAAAITSGILIAAWSGEEHADRTGTHFRCDSAALALVSTTAFGLVAAFSADMSLQLIEGAGCRISWRWWGTLLRVFVQANAYGLTFLMLLDNATVALIQIILVFSASSLVVAVSVVAAHVWRMGSDMVSQLKVIPLIRILSEVRPIWIFFASWLFFLLLAIALLFVKPEEKLGLSSEVVMAEHFCLMFVGALTISWAVSLIALLVMPLGRRLLFQPFVVVAGHAGESPKRRRRPTPSFCETLPRALVTATVCHLMGGLIVAVVGCSFVVVIIIFLAKGSLYTVRIQEKEAAGGVRAVDTTSTVPDEAKVDGPTKAAWQDGEDAKSVASKATNAAALRLKRKKEEAERRSLKGRAKRFLLLIFMLIVGFLKVGAVFTVFLFDVTFVTKHMKKDSGDCASRRAVTGASATPDFSNVRLLSEVQEGQESPSLLNWSTLSDVSFPVAEQEHPARHLATTSSSGPSSPSELPSAVKKVLQDVNLDGISTAAEKAVQVTMDIMEWIVSWEIAVPDSVHFRCTGIRRLVSASAVLSCVGLILVAGMMDLLSILGASKEIARARAGSDGSFARYVLTIAKVQILEFLAIQVLQLAVSSGSRLKFEAMGYFDQNCGYLVDPDNLSGSECPNLWHIPVEAMSSFLLFFGLAMGIYVFVAILSGSFYGLPAAGWIMQAFFGKDLVLANFGGGQKLPPLSRNWLGSRLEQHAFFRMLLRPVMGLCVTLGIWTTWASRTFQCGMRQDWYEPVEGDGAAEAADDDGGDGETDGAGAGAGGMGSSDLVSWKSMYQATSKGIAVVWVPVPLIGSLVSKATLYLNEFVLLAFGYDGGGPSGRPQKIITHMQEDRPSGVQALHWCSQVSLVLILVVIEFDLLKNVEQNQRLTILGVCIALVIIMATIRMALDITLQLKTFKRGRGLLDSIEDIVRGKTLTLICEDPGGEPDKPLQGLPAEDRGKVLLACRELLELSWCQQRFLPRTQRTYLLSSKISASPSTQVAVFGLRSLANEKEHVSPALVRAALILALHDASSNEIESSRAKLQAHRRGCAVAEALGKARALDLQKFLEEEAKRELLREARRRATLFQEARAAKPGRPSTPASQRRLTLTLTGRSRAVVATTAVWKKSTKDLLDKPREVTIEVSATVEAKAEWGPRAVPGTILLTSVTISRSSHQVGEPSTTMKVPRDPKENLPTLRRGFTTKSTRSSASSKGTATQDDEAQDDKDDEEEDVEGQVFGLEWLQECMEGKKWRCCSQAQAIAYEPVAKEPKWEIKDLGTHWYPQGAGAGDSSADINGREHTETLTHATVGITRSMLPAYEESKLASGEEEEMVRCLEDLEEAIRSSLYNTTMLLNTARFLSGLEKGPMSESAARQARLLAVAWKLIKGQERRKKQKEAEDEEERRRRAEEDAARHAAEEEASVIEEPMDAESAGAARALASQEALDKLKELLLLETTSADELSIALDEARRADVDPMVLSRAEEVFVRLVSKQQAALALTAAIRAGMIGGLRSAIKQGRAAGLRTRDFPDSSGQGVLDKAKQLLAEAEGGLREELRSAIDAGAIVALERALAQAKEGGLDETDPDLVKEAQEVLRAAEFRKQRINLLKNALQTNDAELLKATIREVESHDLQKEVDLTKAKLRLQALERAAGKFALAGNGELNRMGEDVAEEGAQQLLVRTRAATALRAAMFQEPVEVDMLKLAVQQARNAGLTNGPDIQRALAMVEAEESKAVAVKRVREAAGRRDVRALQDAISRGNSVGVAPAKLLSAVNQLLDEQAKVAQLAGDHGLGNVVLADVERERRELHDRVQMSNGGLRVVVRIRPLILPESSSGNSNGRGASPAPPLPNHPSSLSTSTASPSFQGLGLAGASVMAGRAHVGLDPNSPMSPHDEERRGRHQELPVVFRVDRNTVAVSKVSARSNAAMGKDDTFRFGAVFGPDSIQAELFSEVQGLVQSAVDGYNVLVLACGPVRGGKTFTMMGENHDARGVVPRVGEELFHVREKDSWRAELEVDLQMLEAVDSTHLVDLLGHWDHRRMPAGVLPPSVRLVSQDGADDVVFGRGATSGAGAMSVVVDNVVTRRVGSKHELKELTQEALSNAGHGGEAPARHIIQLLNLSRRNLATGAETRSKIALVDLAGMGQHAAPEVNAAYKSLEDVLRALAARQQRIPFREHVLPQVLQDCMGGSSKTLIMLALPPEGASRQDSLKAITLASCGTW